MHEQETLEKCFSEDVGPNVFSPLERLFPSSAQSLQETRTTDTLTALYSMNKMQRRQLKSVKIPWDKQGFLFKKKKNAFYTHHSDYHLELQEILPRKLRQCDIAGSGPHV